MKKNYIKKVPHLLAGALILLSLSCKKNSLVNESNEATKTSRLSTNAISPFVFNWETVDWMPTPPGQSQIPPPWIGQGSISSIYGADVINDHKAADGWQLVYNTFNPSATGSLVNPYFILYNPYRGLMRIYLYTTTQFISPSTYIVDGLSIVSSKSTPMLNFLGTDLIDYTKNQTTFSQIEPAPIDGSQPLASNKWYMLQYELAYDPQMATYGYQDIQLSWFTNYNSVSTISLGGTATGTIKTAAAAPESALPTALRNGGQVVGTAILSGLGKDVLKHNGDSTTGINSLGLTPAIYKAALDGVSKSLSGATKGIPGAVLGILSAVLGGSSSSATMNFNLNADIKLTGTQTTSGSFPSSPTSIYVPGTNITSSAQNFIPLYNKTLGVFNLTGYPKFTCKYISGSTSTTDISLTPDEVNGTNLVFNPAVLAIAKIENIKEEVLLIDADKIWPYVWCDACGANTGFFGATGTKETIGKHTVYSQSPAMSAFTSGAYFIDQENGIITDYPGAEVHNGLGLRVSFDVVPNNGAPRSRIVKSFVMGPYAYAVTEL